MRFGVLLNHEFAKTDDLGLRIEQLIRMAETARDLGFESLFGFQHYLGSLATFQPIPILARLIPHTGNLRLGTGVYLATMESPVQLAENFATLDQLSGGRLVLGLGTGYRKNEFAAFGIDPATRWGRMYEILELLRALWTGEEVSYHGRFYTVEGESLSLVPRQSPRPPIWLGASEEARIRSVAEVADSWVAPPNVKLRWAAGHLGFYREALEGRGEQLAGRNFPIIRELHVAETDEQAYAQADEFIRGEYYTYAQYGSDHWQSMYEDLREKAFLFGSPETVAEKLQAHIDAGFTEFIFRFSWAGMPLETALGSLRRFSEEVAPRFQGLPRLMGLPLEGVRVVDLTQLVAGPFCTMLLADMGADVIKIEPPGGELQRVGMKVRDDEDESMSFLNLNRNKRGMVIDLAGDEGRALCHELVRRSDVLVENFRPGVTARLGIDYEALRAIRPELIYASITGFGEVGPYASRPGVDLIAQGMTGLMSVTGHPGGEPAKVGVPVTDLTSGIFCAFGIMNAYVARLTTGEGQRVSSSLFEAGVALAIHESGELWSSGRVPGPLGSSHRLVAPYQALRAADGHLTVGAGFEKAWVQMCETLGREDLLADERFATNARRVENRAALQAELERTLQEAPAATWVERLLAAGVPAGPILDYGQVLDDPHTVATGMVVSYDHPKNGRVKGLGTPFKLSEVETGVRRPAPLLGEHTDEILAELGWTSQTSS